MSSMKLTWCGIVTGWAMVFASLDFASAQFSASGNPNGPMLQTNHPAAPTGDSDQPEQFIIGPFGDPIPLSLDTNSGPWKKTLLNLTGGLIIADDISNEGQPDTLQTFFRFEENFLVIGTPWTDWHEEVLTPGWFWSNPFMVVSRPGEDIEFLGGLINDNRVDFFFNPAPDGSTIQIIKFLQFRGLDGEFDTPDFFEGEVIVLQYPTPEPGSFLLIAAAGAGLLAMRRSRSN